MGKFIEIEIIEYSSSAKREYPNKIILNTDYIISINKLVEFDNETAYAQFTVNVGDCVKVYIAQFYNVDRFVDTYNKTKEILEVEELKLSSEDMQ